MDGPTIGAFLLWLDIRFVFLRFASVLFWAGLRSLHRNDIIPFVPQRAYVKLCMTVRQGDYVTRSRSCRTLARCYRAASRAGVGTPGSEEEFQPKHPSGVSEQNSSYLSPAASLLALTYFWRGRPAFRRAHAFVYDALTHRACAGTEVLSRASALCGVRWAPRNVTPRVRGSSVNCLPANSADETPYLRGYWNLLGPFGTPRRYIRPARVHLSGRASPSIWCRLGQPQTDFAILVDESHSPFESAIVGTRIATFVPKPDKAFSASSRDISCARDGTSAGLDSLGT